MMTRSDKKSIILRCVFLTVGGAVLAFGLYNVHAQSMISEGGTLGMALLLDHLFGISPAISSAVLNILCYILGLRILGKGFMLYSAVSAGSFSLCYAIFEWIGPLFPTIGEIRIVSSIVGALFVGVGVGLCVVAGGAPTGDDALAMSISRAWHTDIRLVYLVSDVSVLLLSLTYIPIADIFYSLVTVILSGQVIGLIEGIAKRQRARRDS